MSSGFIAMPRAVLDVDARDAWFPGDFRTAAVYAYLATKANWCDAAAPLPRQQVALKAGQLVIGERELGERLGLTRQMIRTHLARLTQLGKINPVKNPLGTIITICDYKELFLDIAERQPSEQPTVNPPSTHRQPNQDNVTKRQGDNAEMFPAGGDAPPPEKKRKQTPTRKGTPADQIGRKEDSTDGAKVFAAYYDAHLDRLGAPAIFNEKQAAHCCQLVRRLGLDDSVKVVQFYLRHHHAHYVSKGFPLSLCVQDAESLLTQQRRGRQTTQSEARQQDQTAGNMVAMAAALERFEQRKSK